MGFNITRFGLDGANLVNKENVAIDIDKGIVYKAKQKGDMCSFHITFIVFGLYQF